MPIPHDFNPQQDGISARQREIEQPVVCEQCGSSWFMEATFNQYSGLAYGSSTGADLRVISSSPQFLRVCLCGFPYNPQLSGVRGRTATGELDNFKQSLGRAQQYRKDIKEMAVSSLPAAAAAKSFAPVSEIERLQGVVAGLESQVQELRAAGESEPEATDLEATSLEVPHKKTGKKAGQ